MSCTVRTLEASLPAESSHSEPKNFSRRKFLRRAVRGSLLACTGALGYAHAIEPHWLDVVELPLPVANLPQDMIGKRLAQVSDIHIGDALDDSYMLDCLDNLAQLKPDLLALTGDFMTCFNTEQVDHTLELLQHMPKTPLGSYAVMGNHDYGQWCLYSTAADLLSRGMEDTGVRVLRNEVVDVAGLQIAGLDELLAHRCLIQPTLDQLDPQRAMLTLCHNPDAADQPGWQNFQGWILSGHTHGGQCKLPGFAPPITPVWNKRYTAGTFELAGNRQMYINRGVGYFYRVRFNCRPEITLFTLERA